MQLTVNHRATYCYTGGKPFDAAQPTLIFIHGVLNDHSVWILQTRYFAHHGWNVLALDLPGHGKSGGAPATSVEDAADFIVALMDAVGVQTAALVGHSFGSLVALEVAARAPDRIDQLVMVGTAFPMTVSPALLDASLKQPFKAIDLVNTFSHSMLAPPPSALGPGTWLYGSSRALMRRVLQGNAAHNLFHIGFTACNNYTGGNDAMARARCPTLFILGKHDQMTLPKAAQSLIAKATNGRSVLLDAGHQVMLEAPDATLAALQKFLRPA